MDPTAPDASGDGGDIDFARDTTLVVGKDASLTLGTESLIVLGEHSSSSSSPLAPLRRTARHWAAQTRSMEPN